MTPSPSHCTVSLKFRDPLSVYFKTSVAKISTELMHRDTVFFIGAEKIAERTSPTVIFPNFTQIKRGLRSKVRDSGKKRGQERECKFDFN